MYLLDELGRSLTEEVVDHQTPYKWLTECGAALNYKSVWRSIIDDGKQRRPQKNRMQQWRGIALKTFDKKLLKEMLRH